MEIKKLTILGLSEPTISMIFDNLESNNQFPEITIINNLEIDTKKDFYNPKFNYKVLHKLENYDSAFFVGVLKSKTKKQLIEYFKNISSYLNIIHTNTAISSTTTFGHGCLVNSMVSIAAHSHIGNFVSINRNASIGHHCIIENFSTINPNATIAGSVRVGQNTTIGMGVNIIDGITIGSNTIIGAGSLVTKNIPDNVVAYGFPCEVVRKHE